MKKYNILFVLLIGALFTFISCEESEELNLLTYPDNESSLSISDAEGNSELEIVARYNSDGILTLDEKATRTYVFRFNASPQDIRVFYELISKNIPEELLHLSKTEDVLPKGASDALVTVSLINDDVTFAQENLGEETYELGVKANAEGYKVPSGSLVSKVIIKKEAYSSLGFIVAEESSETSFEKPYVNGAYLDDKPIAYSFTVQVDKPALNDLKIKLTATSDKEEAFKYITLVDEVTIPKGKKSSEVITWTFDRDYLLQSEMDKYLFSLSIELSDQYVSIDENRSSVDLSVQKVMRNIGYIAEKSPDWKEIAKNGWGVELLFSFWGNSNVLVDGDGGTFGPSVYVFSNELPFILDMSKEESIKGFGIDYSDNWGSSSSPKRIKISTSFDKNDWLFQGEVEVPDAYNHYIRALSPFSARYIKFELLDKHNNYIELTEVYVYN